MSIEFIIGSWNPTCVFIETKRLLCNHNNFHEVHCISKVFKSFRKQHCAAVPPLPCRAQKKTKDQTQKKFESLESTNLPNFFLSHQQTQKKKFVALKIRGSTYVTTVVFILRFCEKTFYKRFYFYKY